MTASFVAERSELTSVCLTDAQRHDEILLEGFHVRSPSKSASLKIELYYLILNRRGDLPHSRLAELRSGSLEMLLAMREPFARSSL